VFQLFPAGPRSAELPDRVDFRRATDPSGPNSVLRLTPRLTRCSTPLRVVLTRSVIGVLNGQCSTFRCLLDQERTSWNRAHGRSRAPYGSLERR